LDPANRICASGDQQSPVDLHDGIRAVLPPVTPHWQTGASRVTNNGHTIQLDANPGGWTGVGDRRADLVQFHFHTPSEHAVDGQRSVMEAHFVHQLGDGLAVLGVLLTGGARNDAFGTIMSAAPAQPGEATLSQPLNPIALLPQLLSAAWRYEGSLTTPPCSQTVSWIVLEQSVAIAQSDVDAFRRLFPMNARPLQPLNRRYLLRGLAA
jgi:carbonic anhydrase